jgi:four helix bundle protein
MDSEELKRRTKKFALDIINMVNELPNTPVAKVIGNQFTRAATSVGANYRSACRARSKADFVSKITIVEEEADESCYWLELLYESNLLKQDLFKILHKEGCELTAIFTSAGKTSKQSLQNQKLSSKKIIKSQMLNPKL